MITVSVGMVLLGLCVLGLAVAIGIHDTWELQRQTKESPKQTQVVDRQDDSFREAA